jgi:hypothetical protein
MIYFKMINLSLDKQLSILLPNTNKALSVALKGATKEELMTLSKSKDLGSILSSLLQKSAQDPAQNATLLNLLKNNPTLKDLGNVTTTFKESDNIALKEEQEEMKLDMLQATHQFKDIVAAMADLLKREQYEQLLKFSNIPT